MNCGESLVRFGPAVERFHLEFVCRGCCSILDGKKSTHQATKKNKSLQPFGFLRFLQVCRPVVSPKQTFFWLVVRPQQNKLIAVTLSLLSFRAHPFACVSASISFQHSSKDHLPLLSFTIAFKQLSPQTTNTTLACLARCRRFLSLFLDRHFPNHSLGRQLKKVVANEKQPTKASK